MQVGVAPSVRTGGYRHTGQAAPPPRNIQHFRSCTVKDGILASQLLLHPDTITLNFSPQNAILYSQGDAPPYKCGSRNNWRCPSLSVAVLTTGELQKARLILL